MHVKFYRKDQAMRFTTTCLVLLLWPTLSAWGQGPSRPATASPAGAPLRLVAAPRSGSRPAGALPAARLPAPLSNLVLEVAALETLDKLDLSTAQLKSLQQLARGAAGREDRAAGQGPDALRVALLTMREALLRGLDEQVEGLQDRVADMLDAAGVEVDDSIELTATARKQSPAALKLLKAGQVAAYISEYADDVADPLEELLDAMTESRAADQADFDVLRDQVADDVALATAGLDIEKDRQTSDAVTAWLNKVRALSGPEFEEQRAALEQEARSLVGQVDPLQVIRHYLERDLAELLSNPRLNAVLEAYLEVRIQQARAENKKL
jgi:hypothetical protein